VAAYTPTVWKNYAVGATPMSAANLNKLTNEIKAQATTYSMANSLPTWVDGSAPAITDPAPLNEMERIVAALSVEVGLPYTRTTWLAGWDPSRNAARLNQLEQQVANISVATPTGVLTGTHWVEVADMGTVAAAGFDFVVTAAYSVADATAKLNAATSHGMKSIIQPYPEPYTWTGSTWTISQFGIDMLNYLESRASEQLGVMGYNEPYYVLGYSAAQLRSLRTVIRGVWPGALIYHDIAQPLLFAGMDSAKWGDQSGTVDLCGTWYYPFKTAAVGSYPQYKSYGISILQDNAAFIQSNIGGGARMVWLGQSHSAPSDALVYPTDSQISDWNDAVRAALPADALLSWYVWFQGLYPNPPGCLQQHPTQWPMVTS